MTGPSVWDGQGIDPWLPHRLDARLEAASVERQIRAGVWSALSEWLVALERRMVREGAPPDLTAVWAVEPAWRDAVDALLSGEIWQALAIAFRKIFGAAYQWDTRPAVVRYFTEVRNRLVRIPDEVYDLVAGQLSAGVNLGEGIPELAARVDTVLSTTQSARWQNRATVIARTETIGALNFGRWESFRVIIEDDPDENFELMWLATHDHRVRPTHGRGREDADGNWIDGADGQRVPVGTPFTVGGFELAFPGDPTGPPQEVIQCRCTLLLVDKDEVVDLSNRQMRAGR